MKYILFIFINIFLANDFQSSVGFCTNNPSFNDCKTIKENNFEWIRVGARWATIERKKGEFNWTRLDSIVTNASNNNLNILLIVNYGNSIYLNDSLKTNNFVKDNKIFTHNLVKPYKKFLKKLIKRYKKQIFYYEIWNEPDLKKYFNGSNSDYFDLLKLSHRIIKKIHPNSFILNGGVSGKNIDYWHKVLSAEYSEYFDIFNFHLYKHCNKKSGLYKNYLDEVIKVTSNINKPIWITETGLAKKNEVSSYCGGYSEKIQISETIRRLLINKNYGINNTFIFSFKNRCKDKTKMDCNYGYIENPYFGTDRLKQIINDIKKNHIDMIDINNYKLSNGKVIKIINNQIIYNN